METKVNVPEEFILSIEGKPFVLYAGLLQVASQERIRELSVSIVQTPSEGNSYTAIVEAKAVTRDGSIFVDLGDASPKSVGDDRFTLHLIRVASTRAKARVIRDAYALAMTSVEELPITSQYSNGSSSDNSHQIPAKQYVPKPEEPATEKQLNMLYQLAKQVHLPKDDYVELGRLSKAAASKKINELKSLARSNKT